MNIQTPVNSSAFEASIQQSLNRMDGELAGAPASAPSGSGFAQTMQQALANVDGKEHNAADRMAAVDSGKSDDLVGAMLASQDASLSFSMLMQVRNKVMGAMEEVLKLQL